MLGRYILVWRATSPSADKLARRRAADSLDTYLLAAGQQQVFGTQTEPRAVLARLDCALLNPSIRNAFSVVEVCVRKDRTTADFVR